MTRTRKRALRSSAQMTANMVVKNECVIELRDCISLCGLPRTIEILRWSRAGDAKLLAPEGLTLLETGGVLLEGGIYGWTAKCVKRVLVDGAQIWPQAPWT